MPMQREALAFREEVHIRMQELAEFLAKDTRISLALTSQLHDEEILLTPGGFLMLAIPLIEGGQLQEPGSTATVSPSVARQSVAALLATLKQEPAPADARLGATDTRSIVVGRKPSLLRRTRPIELGPRENLRSSLSVIRAYWKRYCNIPPFCESGQ